MRSLLKRKKPEAAAANVMPVWHPDFRNPERLPDTKVVRTAFFVNGLAILGAAVLLLWCAYQGYQLRDVNRQVSEWERQIDRDRKPSAQAVELYKNFQAKAARVEEIDGFVTSRPAVSPILLRVAETLPAFLALDRFQIRDTTVSLRGTVRGSPDQASGYASTYLQQLKTDEFFTERFGEIKLVALTRNTAGRLVVEITMQLKEPRKP